MSHFQDTGSFTSDVRYHGNGYGNWDKLTNTCYKVLNIPHCVQIFLSFALAMSRFRDTGPFTLDVRYHGNEYGNWEDLTNTCYMVLNIPHKVEIVVRFAVR